MDSNMAGIIFIVLIPLVLFVVKLMAEKLQNQKDEELETMAAEQLVKTNFRFLIDDYGFECYELYSFRSSKMLIKVLPGHKTPRIDFIKIGEDPDLFKLNFEWIIKFFHGSFPSETHDYLKYGLDTNLLFVSKIFRENSHRLIDEIDDWWIPVHLFCYRTVEEEYRSKGQTEIFLKAQKYRYDYLKSKGAI